MSEQRPPGWYQDPFGTSVNDQRYWDGETWQANTPPPTPTVQAAPTQIQEPGWGQRPQSDAERDRTFTPDGVQLASWGRRLIAFIFDGIVLGIVALIASSFTNYWDVVNTVAADAGGMSETELLAELQRYDADIAQASLVISFTVLIFNAMYTIVMTARRGATLGKLIVGIRVRMRDEEAKPTYGTAALRWIMTGFLPSIANMFVPALSFLTLVDGLWPIWDARRQAIHDKIARTNVVVGRTPHQQ